MQRTLFKLRSFYLITGMSGGLLIPYLSLLLIHDGLNSSQIGQIMAVGTLIALLAQPVWGYLVDRFHVTRMTLALSTLVPGLLAILYNSHWLLLLALTSVLSNLFSIPQAPIADSFAISIARSAQISYGSIRLFGSLGFGIGSYGGGLYLAHWPVTTLWIPFAVLGLIGTVLAFLFPTAPLQVGVGSSMLQGVAELVSDKRFLAFLGGGFLVSQTLTAFNTYFAVTFQAMGGSLNLTGVAFFLAAATNVPAMMVAARVIARIGREWTMLLSAIAYILRWSVQAFVPDPTVAIVIQVLHGVSFGFFYVAAVDFVSRSARRELQATAQSVFAMVSFGFAGIFGNLLNGYLLRFGGPSLMYEVCTVSAALGVACFAYVAKTRPRPVGDTFTLPSPR